MPTPLTLIIFGATGDLTARKLAPSLYRMASKGRLPGEARIVGCARTPLSDDAFRDRLGKAVREFAKNDWDESKWRAFAPRLFYVPADAAKPGGLDGLKAWLEKNGAAGGRRLFYLAVAPTLYAGIARGLGAEGLNRSQGDGWSRLIIEKPFGHDLASARDLNRVLRENFHEDQVYRIDHYLGKETVQNVLVFRFANTLFEPVWNYRYIDHVHITVSETVKMEGRGDYYDKSGVLRDMFQNHLLQLLTMAAMEAPARFAADMLRNEKASKVLRRRAGPGAGRGGQLRRRLKPVRRLSRGEGRGARLAHADLRRGAVFHRELAAQGRACRFIWRLRQGG